MTDPQHESSDPSAGGKPLSAEEATELAGRIAELARAGLPLAPGLRAAAAELPRSRVAAALKRVAAALDRGESLEQAISAERGGLPKHLQALVAAGIRTGRLGLVLEEFVQFQQQTDDIRRSVWRAMAYPALLIVLLIVAVMFYVGSIVPQVAQIRRFLDQTPIEKPESVRVDEWVAAHAQGLVVGAIAIVAALVVVRLAAARLVRRILNRLPIFGSLWRFSGLAEWATLLRILVTSEVPLPEALKLSSEGLRDADLADALNDVSGRVKGATRLSDAIAGWPQFGSTVRPFLAWGEENSSLPEALGAIASSAIDRLQRRAELIKAIGPPAVFLVVTGVLILALRMLVSIRSGVVSTSFLSGPTPSPELVWPAPSFSGALGLMVLGWVTLIVVAITYRRFKPPADAPQIMMRLAGWLLIAFGALGMLLIYWGGAGLILWLLGIAVWGGAVYRFRRSQKFAQLNLMAAAADRGMPLGPVVRAMAEEEGGRFYFRAMALADPLANGTPIALAVRANRKVLPPLAFVAARIGEVTGALGQALRAVDDRNRPASAGSEAPARVWSLMYVAAVLSGGVIYMGKRISPQFRFIFRDFRRPLPPFTSSLFDVISSPWITALCAIAFVATVCLAFYAFLRELGWIQRGLPLVERLTAPRDAAPALRLLSIVASQGRPIVQALEFLTNYYPRALIRKRLRTAFADMSLGGDCATSLRKAKLVGRTDEAILRAAARAGNLPWALAEAAANGERRANYRLAAIGQVLFPLLILAVGAVVMMFVIGWFLPLIELINNLAQPRW